MRPVRICARRRAAALLLSCLTVAGLGTFSHGAGGVPLDGAPDQGAADLLHAVRAQVGDAYLWGGDGPDAWDCSGLTRLWRGVPGVKGMPRVSREQLEWAVPIPREQLLVGDLVFFNEPVDHVAVYAGDGRIVDASSAKAGVVERPLWKAAVMRYGRVPRPGMPQVLPWTPPPPPKAVTATDPFVGVVPSLPAPDAGPPPRTSRSKPVAAKPVAAKPTGKPAAKPTGTSTAKPTGKPTAKPTGTSTGERRAEAAEPAPRSPAQPGRRALPGRRAAGEAAPTAAAVPARLTGLPARQRQLSSVVAYSAAAAAKAREGEPAGPGGWTDVALVAAAWRDAGGGSLPADRDALAALGRPVPLADARIGDLVVYGRPAVPHLGVYLGGGRMVDASPRQGRVVVRPVYAARTVRLVRLG